MLEVLERAPLNFLHQIRMNELALMLLTLFVRLEDGRVNCYITRRAPPLRSLFLLLFITIAIVVFDLVIVIIVLVELELGVFGVVRARVLAILIGA